MDPRYRADEALARARARGAFVVTPDNATSPMDAAQTQRIPREVVSRDDPDPTLQLRGQETEGSAAWPTEDYQQRNDSYGRPVGQQGPSEQPTAQQYPAQEPGRQEPSRQEPSHQEPGRQEPPQAPQWPAGQYRNDQHPSDSAPHYPAPDYPAPDYSAPDHSVPHYAATDHSAAQSSADEWSWPATRFGPLNPETARGLQW